MCVNYREKLLAGRRPKEFKDTDETKDMTNRDLYQQQQATLESAFFVFTCKFLSRGVILSLVRTRSAPG